MNKLILAAAFCLSCAPAFCAPQQAYLDYMEGAAYESDGKFSDALSSYRKAIAADPQAEDAYVQALKLDLQSGQVDEAYKFAAELVKMDASSSRYWTFYAAANWAKGDAAEAEKAYEKALKLDPKNTDAIYQVAALLKRAQPEKAVSYLRRYAMPLEEEKARASYEIGLIRFSQKMYAEAGTSFDDAVKLAPSYLPARYARAQLFEVQGDTIAALGAYAEIEPLDPTNAGMLSHMGELYLSAAKAAESEIYFNKALAVDSSNPEACFWLSVFAEDRKDYAQSFAYIKRSANFEKDPALWLRASYSLTQSGDYSGAVDLMEKAFAKWPDNFELGYFLALGFDDTGRTDKALAVLKKMLDAKPDYDKARIQYAELLVKAGRDNEAEPELRMLLKKNPNDPVLLNFLGYLLADSNRKLDEAEALIGRALAQDGANGAYNDSMGWLYFRKGDKEKAFNYVSRASVILPKDDSVWLHLCKIEQARGNFGSAINACRHSLAAKPDARQAREAFADSDKKLSSAARADAALSYLSGVYGAMKGYSALTKITLGALGKSETVNALFQYKADGTVKLEILGPMFTPLCTMRLTDKGFEVDTAAGEPDPRLRTSAEELLGVLRDFYSAAVFTHTAGAEGYPKIKTAAYELETDKYGLRLESAEKKGGKLTLSFGGFESSTGRPMPSTVRFSSGGVSVEMQFIKTAASPISAEKAD